MHLETIGETSREDKLRKSRSIDAAFAKNNIDVKTAKRKNNTNKQIAPSDEASWKKK